MDTRRDFVFIDDLVDCVMKSDRRVSGGLRLLPHLVRRDYSIKRIVRCHGQRRLGISMDGEVEVRPRNPDDAYTILLDPSKTNQTF